MNKEARSFPAILLIALLSACGPAPTSTPLPTATLLSAPSPAPASIGADPCLEAPPMEPMGDTAQVTFVNKSNGQVALSFGMYQANNLGECGTYNFSMDVDDAPTVTVMAGCYWGYAWITGNESFTAKSTTPICAGPGETIPVSIGVEGIGAE